MPSYKQDRHWQQAFVPQGIDICNAYFYPRTFIEAPAHEDNKHNTDLIATDGSVRIAMRVRRHEYFLRWPYDVTFRFDREQGPRTELRKTMDGWGTHQLYGFASPGDVPPIHAWTIGDLACFRTWYQDYWDRYGRAPGQPVPNGDGTSGRAYDIRTIPGFVFARYVPHLTGARRW